MEGKKTFDQAVMEMIVLLREKNYKKTKYFYSDFKKKMGINIAREIRDSYGLYQQDYCGCEYSIYPKKHK